MADIDLLAALAGALDRAREHQRKLDNEPCPKCGGDRLRRNFTPGEPCHAPHPTGGRNG